MSISGRGDAVVEVPQHADMPGRCTSPCITGVKECTEKMNGALPRCRGDRGDHRGDRVVIGPVEALEPPLAFVRRPADSCRARWCRHRAGGSASDRLRRDWDRSAGARNWPAPPARRVSAASLRVTALDADVVGDVALRTPPPAGRGRHTPRAGRGWHGRRPAPGRARASPSMISNGAKTADRVIREMVCSRAAGLAAIVIPRTRTLAQCRRLAKVFAEIWQLATKCAGTLHLNRLELHVAAR